MTSTFGEASFLCPLATPKDYYADLWPVNRKEPTRRPSTPALLNAGTQPPECLAKRDLRSRDGEDGKTALQRDGRATHGVAGSRSVRRKSGFSILDYARDALSDSRRARLRTERGVKILR